MNALKPSVQTLVKLGSIARHAEEMLSDDGHVYDADAIKGLLADEDVQRWMAAADRLALLPVVRKGRA